MARGLVKLLQDDRDEIVIRWSSFLKEMKSTSYEARPFFELKGMCQEFFDGYIQMLSKGDYGPLREFIEKKARLRTSMGFKLSEAQRALYTIKEVILPFIREEYGDDLGRFDDALQRIDSCLIKTIFDFSEVYQHQVKARMHEYLADIEQFNRRLEHLSITDGLTGLYNHKYFQDVLARELKRAERYGRPLSLVIFDIDNFKSYNDTYGHARGDEVIQKIAEILQEETRVVDLAARYGGEEFVLVLPETEAREARVVAEKVRKLVESHSFWAGEERRIKISLSAGVSEATEYPMDKETLIEQADRAMYQAKKKGKNKVSVFADVAGR